MQQHSLPSPRLAATMRLSRSEIRKETTSFLKTHQWDDTQGADIERRTN